MFDLFRSRDKAVRIFLGLMLGLVAVAMLLYLIPGAGLGTANASDQTVAEIGPYTLTTADVQQTVQNMLKSRQVPPEFMSVYLPQLVEQMIRERALAYEAQRLGLRVSDADVAATIRSLPQFANLPPDQYQATLASMGYSVPQFESNLRTNTYMVALQNIAIEGVIVTPKEIAEEYTRANEKAKLDYIAFDSSKLKADIHPSDSELQQYFEQNKNGYKVPEERSYDVVVVDQAKAAASLQIPDAQLQTFYNANIERFRTPERVQVRHILLKTVDKPKDDIPKIRARAQDLLNQLKKGADFADMAKKYSEDPGSGKAGGELGWVTRGQMVKNFENASFTQPVGQLSDLVTTEYGFHIVQVEKKEPAHLQSFAEARDQIMVEVKKEALNQHMQDLADQARAQLTKDPQNAQQIAEKLNLAYVKMDKAKPTDPVGGLQSSKEVGEAVFGLKKNEVSQVVQGGNALAVAVLKDIVPSHPAAYAEVAAQVRDRYATMKAAELARTDAQKAMDLLKANGGNLQAAAKSLGTEVKTGDPFTRNGALEGAGSATNFPDAFTKPVGSIIGPVNSGTMTVIAKITDRIEPDLTKLASQRDSMVAQIKAKKQEQRMALFQDAVVTRLVQDGKIKINKDVMNKLQANYRGA